MKFNFRKVASVIASAVMLGSTAGFALAATYPAPFVVNGVPNGAIVASSGDASVATTIQNNLQSKITSKGEGEEVVSLSRSSDKLNLGEDIKTVFATSITKTHLPNLLADETYYDKSNNEFGYTQKIELGSGLTLTHFADSDYKNKEPTIGFHLTRGTHILTYTLDFTTEPDWDATKLETTDIKILGKDYYILDVDTNKITLLDAGTTVTVSEGETKNVNVGGKSYDISIVWVGSDKVKLKVNGEETNILDTTSSPYKLRDGTYVGVKTIMYNPKDTGISKVEVTIGSGKLELKDGSNIELNDKSIDGLKAYIDASSGKLHKIVIEWDLDEESFLTTESELEMPALASIKLLMENFVTPAEEEIKIENDGSNSIRLVAPIKDGKATITLLTDANEDGTFDTIGKDSEKLVTTNESEMIVNLSNQEKYFVASWASSKEAESYFLEVKVDRKDNEDVAIIKNVLTRNDVCPPLTAGDSCSVGNIILTVNNVSKADKWVNLSIGSGGSFDKLYTNDGLTIYLPYNSKAAGYNAINLSASPTSWTLHLKEEDKDENIASGKEINVTLGFNSDNETRVSGISADWAGNLYKIDDSKVYEGYVESALATKVLWDKSEDQYTAKIIYHDKESYATVKLSSTSGVSAPTIPVVKPEEAASYSDKNLIVVGGSCVNSLAAQIMGVPANTCGESQNVIAPGKYLIKVVKSPLNADKIAVLVAGWEAEDTKKAADKLMEGTLITEAGQEISGPATGA